MKLLIFIAMLIFTTEQCDTKHIVGGTKTVIRNKDTAFHAKFHQNVDSGECFIISMNWVRKYEGFKDESQEAVHITKKAALQPLGDSMLSPRNNSNIVEIYGREEENVRLHVDLYCKTLEDVRPTTFGSINLSDNLEIRKIVDHGDQENRIDVVFMGDGYTQEERDLFYEDMERLVFEMFSGVTFRSYLPLFNIWAIFVPSVESGIGYDGAKDTAFRLYREKGQLRGIFPGNASYARTVCQMTGTSGCDYPTLIANDNYYGGLGGEFVISTRSKRTGTMVLRHEMGHNFVNVGEEYDNGYSYDGVNAADNLENLGWAHWLSGSKREEKAIYRLLEHPWYDLSKGEKAFTFVSDGHYSRWYVKVSVSAAGESDSLEFILDKKSLPWSSRGFDDREFYSWSGATGFSQGWHKFSVRSKTISKNPDIPRMICSISIHEYGSEDEFKISNDYISAYPTWDIKQRKTYRPTNEGCLMRNMSHTSLCNVCKEGMWYEFFSTISLIDNVVVSKGELSSYSEVTVNTLKLAHFREPGNEIIGEELKIRWFKDGVEQEQLEDSFTISAEAGDWTVKALFITPEVRYDPKDLLKDSVSFSI